MLVRTMRIRRLPRAKTQRGGTGLVARPSSAVGIVFAILLISAGCGSSQAPVKLADGSTGAPIPEALKGLGHTAVLTTVRVVPLHALDARARACVEPAARRSLAPNQLFVQRVDHYGSSVTFRPRGGPFILGCTYAAGRPATKSTWCGHVVGEIRDGHLVDPRLDIACRTSAGSPIGSAWIEPVVNAQWIVVRGHVLTQIYPAAGSLPVRVTTLSADVPTATAVFRVEQYDADGTRVSEETLRTAVAG